MKAELQFFMTPKDTEDFLRFTQDKVDAIEEARHFIIGDCEIHHEASLLSNDTIFIGRINIDTGDINHHCKDQERAKAVFRTLRNWLKKHYTCKLSTASLDDPDKRSMSRSHWLGPDAKRWKEKDASNRLLRLSTTSPATFDVAKISKLMGEIVPKKSRKKRGST